MCFIDLSLDWNEAVSLSVSLQLLLEMKHKAKTKYINKNRRTTEDNIQELWDNFKWHKIYIIGISEREVKENGAGEMFKVTMAQNYLKFLTDIKTQIQEARRTSKHQKHQKKNLYNRILYSNYIFKNRKIKERKYKNKILK